MIYLLLTKVLFLLDVIGLITSTFHDKDFFLDGTVSQSVTFTLHDGRFVFHCFYLWVGIVIRLIF
jgi:hypothetical protein